VKGPPSDSQRTRVIAQYLDRPDVRLALGTDPAVSGNYSGCSTEVGRAFGYAQDGLRSSEDYVASLLERGVQALIYVGKNDFMCNHVGNERWTTDLEWTGGDEFRKQELKPWIVGDKRVGDWRSANGLVYATIEGAGHMVRAPSSFVRVYSFLSRFPLINPWNRLP